MLDVVKFTWRNGQGYWIPAAWMMCTSNREAESLRSWASIGRPGMTDMKVLDRVSIPEELRLTGRARTLLSKVVVYDKQADDYTAAQMIDAMVAWTA